MHNMKSDSGIIDRVAAQHVLTEAALTLPTGVTRSTKNEILRITTLRKLVLYSSSSKATKKLFFKLLLRNPGLDNARRI